MVLQRRIQPNQQQFIQPAEAQIVQNRPQIIGQFKNTYILYHYIPKKTSDLIIYFHFSY